MMELKGVRKIAWNPERKELEISTEEKTEGIAVRPKTSIRLNSPVKEFKASGSPLGTKLSGGWEAEMLTPAICRVEDKDELTEVTCE
jgi:hypothetical protein